MSIIETCKYALEYKISTIIYFFDKHEIWRNLTMIGVLIIQLLFWCISYGWIRTIAKEKKWKQIYIIIVSFLYGLGMSAFAIVSFMVFYWISYNWMFQDNQRISTIIGTIGCLISMVLVYYDNFKLDKLMSFIKHKILKR